MPTPFGLTGRRKLRLFQKVQFLREAEMMDPEALPATLKQPMVMRALEELKMLTQTDLERERYEARRKAQLDENNIVKAARLEGREEGRVEGRTQGEKIGIIHLCEHLLHKAETPTEELMALSLEDLARRAEELQGQVLKQG